MFALKKVIKFKRTYERLKNFKSSNQMWFGAVNNEGNSSVLKETKVSQRANQFDVHLFSSASKSAQHKVNRPVGNAHNTIAIQTTQG